EPYKGSHLVRQVFDLLQKQPDLNFIGNIESNDIFFDVVDVVVTDGFTGNVLLKSVQGTSRSVVGWIKEAAQQSLWSRVAFSFIRPLLYRLKDKIEYSRTGGALLLGVKKPVVMAHGSSKKEAVQSAIMVA